MTHFGPIRNSILMMVAILTDMWIKREHLDFGHFDKSWLSSFAHLLTRFSWTTEVICRRLDQYCAIKTFKMITAISNISHNIFWFLSTIKKFNKKCSFLLNILDTYVAGFQWSSTGKNIWFQLNKSLFYKNFKH